MAKIGNRQYKTFTCTECKGYSYRIDKNVKAECIERANNQSYNKLGKLVVPGLDISATTDIK